MSMLTQYCAGAIVLAAALTLPGQHALQRPWCISIPRRWGRPLPTAQQD